jgi:hypothetical protein
MRVIRVSINKKSPLILLPSANLNFQTQMEQAHALFLIVQNKVVKGVIRKISQANKISLSLIKAILR